MDIEKAVGAMLPKITDDIAAELSKRALQSLEYTVAQEVQSTIKKYIEERILPSVVEELKTHDAEIRAAILGGVLGGVKSLGESITKRLTEHVGGYQGEKLVREVLQILTPGRY